MNPPTLTKQFDVGHIEIAVLVTIELAEVIEERNEFVWIVSYDGPESWDAKQAEYYASPERAAVDPDPAQYIAKTERWFIKSVLPGR